MLPNVGPTLREVVLQEETLWVEVELPNGKQRTFQVGKDNIRRITIVNGGLSFVIHKQWPNGRRWNKAYNGPFRTVGWKPHGSA